MKQLTNTFTIIFMLAAAGSLFQLGSLGNGITATFADTIQSTITPILPTATPVPTKSEQPKAVFTPERIVISEIDVDMLVFSQQLKNGTWEVLPHVANYAEGTSAVNPNDGNVGIFAYDKLDGFTKIEQLSEGSEIIVYGLNEKAVYKVTSVKVADATDVSVYKETKEPTLTLVTCDEAFSEKRYIVKADLEKIDLTQN